MRSFEECEMLARQERDVKFVMRRVIRKKAREEGAVSRFLTDAFLFVLFVLIALLLTTHARSVPEADRPAVITYTAIDPDRGKIGRPEEDENARIEAALLEKADCIQNCTVTWYTNNTCGKKPGDRGYGITRSGEHTATHCTVAVDPALIPLGSDVCVRYADGETEWFRATDTGVRGAHVDIFTDSYDYAIRMGLQKLTVWYIPPVTVSKD